MVSKLFSKTERYSRDLLSEVLSLDPLQIGYNEVIDIPDDRIFQRSLVCISSFQQHFQGGVDFFEVFGFYFQFPLLASRVSTYCRRSVMSRAIPIKPIGREFRSLFKVMDTSIKRLEPSFATSFQSSALVASCDKIDFIRKPQRPVWHCMRPIYSRLFMPIISSRE